MNEHNGILKNELDKKLSPYIVLKHLVDYIKMYNGDGVSVLKVNIEAQPAIKEGDKYQYHLRVLVSPNGQIIIDESLTEAEEKPPDLGVNVTDSIDLSERIG